MPSDLLVLVPLVTFLLISFFWYQQNVKLFPTLFDAKYFRLSIVFINVTRVRIASYGRNSP